MRIHKCDICRKEIEFNGYINVRLKFDNYEFCNDCGKPIFNFLKKQKLVRSGKMKNN